MEHGSARDVTQSKSKETAGGEVCWDGSRLCMGDSEASFLCVHKIVKKMSLHKPITPLIGNTNAPRARIFKLLRSGIDSKESIPAAYVAWRAGTTTVFPVGSWPP